MPQKKGISIIVSADRTSRLISLTPSRGSRLADVVRSGLGKLRDWLSSQSEHPELAAWSQTLKHTQFMKPQKKSEAFRTCFLREQTSFPPTQTGLQVVDGPILQWVVQTRQSTVFDHVQVLGAESLWTDTPTASNTSQGSVR